MRDFFELHPAIRIMVWVACALVAFSAAAPALLSMTLLAAADFRLFLRLLRRIRWILIALFAVYAYSTPGAAFFDSWLSPTREGLLAGLLQSLRIVATLAALSFLLATTPRMQILAGIYDLVRPFSVFGLNAQRIAVRLWLTLEYAESDKVEWKEMLGQDLAGAEFPARRLTLELYRLRMRDHVAIMLLFISGAMLL